MCRFWPPYLRFGIRQVRVISSFDKKNISLLGSTGSVGVSCLEVLDLFPERFQVKALTAAKNIQLLAKQIEKYKPELAVVLTEELADDLKQLLGSAIKTDITFGREAYIIAASLDSVDTVVSAMVGRAGLEPTWAAVKSSKRVALANKETLVMAGELIMNEAKKTGAEILPVDSEHSAIFQALAGQRFEDILRLVLTASGGPFLGRSRESLENVTKAEALNHPSWDMGAKISIDSATLMNKGLETIEARWLFDMPLDKIAVQIHPQSIVHSMVEFIDGSVIAQMGVPDMRVPIAYALSYPERLPLNLPGLDLPNLPKLSFDTPDMEAFPCLALAIEAGTKGGTSPVFLNAANEIAVQAFLDDRLDFPGIARVVGLTMEGEKAAPMDSIQEVISVDEAAREKAARIIENF